MLHGDVTVLVRGAGELASGIAHLLCKCHLKVLMTEVSQPLAVRRGVSFCEAVYEGEKEVEGIIARLISSPDETLSVWSQGQIPLLVDPEAGVRRSLKPDVLVDAIIAKKNLGTEITDAPLVIGVGIGFQAGRDAHVVIETNRGHNLGRMITQGEAEPDTGIPGEIAGFSAERVFRTPVAGTFSTDKRIGDYASAGEVVASVDGVPIRVQIGGVIRGLLRDGIRVRQGIKAGDVDPRGVPAYCWTISDKSRAVAGGVMASVLSGFNV